MKSDQAIINVVISEINPILVGFKNSILVANGYLHDIIFCMLDIRYVVNNICGVLQHSDFPVVFPIHEDWCLHLENIQSNLVI